MTDYTSKRHCKVKPNNPVPALRVQSLQRLALNLYEKLIISSRFLRTYVCGERDIVLLDYSCLDDLLIGQSIVTWSPEFGQ
jgi:hypothetical protein